MFFGGGLGQDAFDVFRVVWHEAAVDEPGDEDGPVGIVVEAATEPREGFVVVFRIEEADGLPEDQLGDFGGQPGGGLILDAGQDFLIL